MTFNGFAQNQYMKQNNEQPQCSTRISFYVTKKVKIADTHLYLRIKLPLCFKFCQDIVNEQSIINIKNYNFCLDIH